MISDQNRQTEQYIKQHIFEAECINATEFAFLTVFDLNTTYWSWHNMTREIWTNINTNISFRLRALNLNTFPF